MHRPIKGLVIIKTLIIIVSSNSIIIYTLLLYFISDTPRTIPIGIVNYLYTHNFKKNYYSRKSLLKFNSRYNKLCTDLLITILSSSLYLEKYHATHLPHKYYTIFYHYIIFSTIYKFDLLNIKTSNVKHININDK